MNKLNCEKHGEVFGNDIYLDEHIKNGYTKTKYIYKCAQCLNDDDFSQLGYCIHHKVIAKKLIKIHVKGTEACRVCHRETAGKKRNSDRRAYNKKIAQDKKDNPEKYKNLYKNNYKKLKEKFGDYHSLNKVCRTRGITLEDYKKMLDEQNERCAICNKEETCIDGRSKDKRPRRLSIDHCHETNKVRGLLCHACNVGIGKFKDDVEMMKKAINYIKNHQGKT